MKILIADHYGMCFGVRDALAAAERLTQQGPLTILGELVHNPIVRERLAQQGAQEGKLDEVGGAPTAQSTAYAVQGLVAAAGDAAAVRRGQAYLRSLTEPNGLVRYSRTSRQTPVWVSAQALLALHRRTF